MKHHPTKSPSSLDSKDKCVFFTSGEAGEPAIQGIKLHSFFEKVCYEEDPKEIERIHNELINEGVDKEKVEGIYWAKSELETLLNREDGLEATLRNRIDNKQVQQEQEVKVVDDNFKEISYGTLDLFSDFGETGFLVDLKTGRDNDYELQMLFYALAMFQARSFQMIKVVELYSSMGFSKIYYVNEEECRRKIFAISEKIDNSHLYKRHPFSKCNWCEKAKTCDARRLQVAEVVEAREEFPKSIDFKSSRVRDALIALNLEDPEANKEKIQELSEEMMYIYDCATQAEKFLSGAKASITKLFNEGISIDGLKFQQKKGSMTITDVNEVFKMTKMNPEDFLKLTKVSIKDLSDAVDVESLYQLNDLEIPEEFIGVRSKKLLKSKAKNALENLINPFCERGTGSTSVVRDKKKAVK